MSKKGHQYTIRNVPARVHRSLKQRASERRVSLNTVVLEALEAEAGLSPEPLLHHDLDAFFGTWVSDPKVDRALAEQRKVDPRDWA